MKDIQILFHSLLISFLTAETIDYCEYHASCLDHLENKQRECLKLPEGDLLKENNQLLECQRKRRRKLRVELSGLQLRKTELLRDCVYEHLDRAESILDKAKEKKCQSVADKMSIINEILLNLKVGGGKKSRNRRQNSKQSTKFCRRSKKMLTRKCKQLSKCCSLSAECELRVSDINDQILTLRQELRQDVALSNATCML